MLSQLLFAIFISIIAILILYLCGKTSRSFGEMADLLEKQNLFLSELNLKVLMMANKLEQTEKTQKIIERDLFKQLFLTNSFLQKLQSLTFAQNHLNDNYGQTSSDHYSLKLALEKQAHFQHDKEIQLFLSFLEYYSFKKNESILLFSLLNKCYFSNPSIENIKLIQYNLSLSNLNKTLISEIDNQSNKSDYFLITNPYLANLILLSPKLIKHLSRKIKDAFIFPIYYNQASFSVIWGGTFSSYERNDEHDWRWAIGATNIHSIYLTNNSLNTKNITLEYNLWITDATNTNFEIYFLNEHLKFSISHNMKLSFQLSIPPGSHQLIFHYKNNSALNDHDERFLNFAIVNFNLYSDDGVIKLEKKDIYSQEKDIEFSPISDEIIRNTIHNNGFFEINTIKYQLNSLEFLKSSTSRFHMINNFYEFQNNTTPDVGSHPDIIWYIAKRRASFNEDYHA